LNSAILPSVRAGIQIAQHNPKAALQSLEVARPLDFCEAIALAPAYFRGLAYLEDGNSRQAAREFQSVIDHRAFSPTSPYVVLSELELGHALQLTGDRERAKQIFQELDNIWHDADRDFLPLKRLRQYERN
jgi:lipopolysaccharide biosynthesis regulator YciM